MLAIHPNFLPNQKFANEITVSSGGLRLTSLTSSMDQWLPRIDGSLNSLIIKADSCKKYIQDLLKHLVFETSVLSDEREQDLLKSFLETKQKMLNNATIDRGILLIKALRDAHSHPDVLNSKILKSVYIPSQKKYKNFQGRKFVKFPENGDTLRAYFEKSTESSDLNSAISQQYYEIKYDDIKIGIDTLAKILTDVNQKLKKYLDEPFLNDVWKKRMYGKSDSAYNQILLDIGVKRTIFTENSEA